jgi:hypothetical protein
MLLSLRFLRCSETHTEPRAEREGKIFEFAEHSVGSRTNYLPLKERLSLYSIFLSDGSTSLYSGQDVGWTTGEPFWAPGVGSEDFPSSHNFPSSCAMDWVGCLHRCVAAELEK